MIKLNQNKTTIFFMKTKKSSKKSMEKTDLNQQQVFGVNDFSDHLQKSFITADDRTVKEILDDKLSKGIITKELHSQALKQYEDVLVKAKKGEGSKGGHVIGHTKSGKPVYANKDFAHKDYKNFTSQDHIDASDLHGQKSEYHRIKGNQTSITANGESHSTLQKHHRDLSDSHREEAHKQISKEHKDSLSADEKKILADQNKKQIEHHEKAREFHNDVAKYISSKRGELLDTNSISGQEYQRHIEYAKHHQSEKERLEKEQ